MNLNTTTVLQLSEIRNVEIFLAQCVLYMLLWLIDEYTATLVTSVLVPILGGILIIALIAELVDRSKISNRYFYIMLLSIAAPILVAAGYGLIIGFNYDWPMV